MTTPLRILMIEDDPFDCELLSFAFKRRGVEHTVRQVDNEPELRDALQEFAPHVVICDFSLPGFDGFEALKIAGATCPSVPFFFSSGSIGRERAQLAIKQGASGYALKGDYRHLLEQIREHLPDYKI